MLWLYLQSERLRVVETNMEESSVQLAASEAGSAGPEERLQQASATCKALTAQVEVLTNNNEQLRKELEEFEKEKEGTNKTIAMLEFNNEHNKNKVSFIETFTTCIVQDFRKGIQDIVYYLLWCALLVVIFFRRLAFLCL